MSPIFLFSSPSSPPFAAFLRPFASFLSFSIIPVRSVFNHPRSFSFRVSPDPFKIIIHGKLKYVEFYIYGLRNIVHSRYAGEKISVYRNPKMIVHNLKLPEIATEKAGIRPSATKRPCDRDQKKSTTNQNTD
jgi:hypothetical protein